MKRKELILGIIFIALAATARLIKHPANFSPVGTIALFGGAVFIKKYWKYIIPILALYFSDFFLNNTILRMWYPEQQGLIFFADYMIWSYISFIGAVIIGHKFIKSNSLKSILGGALGFTILFYLVSNFGVWASAAGNFYPDTIGGLVACYAAGLPFVKSSLAGNLFYCLIMFGGYNLAMNPTWKPLKL